MKEMGLEVNKPQFAAEHKKPIFQSLFKNHLGREFDQMMPNMVWVNDITYAMLGDTYYFICVILDLFSRRLLSFGISNVLIPCLYQCSANDFVFEDAFCIAIELVAHDEQIMVADYYDYISGYTIFCDLSEDDANWQQTDDRLDGRNATYYTKHKILDMQEKDIQELCSVPFILDFDLDYFTHPHIINANFQKNVGVLIRRAAAITIAKEPEYFDYEKSDKTFSNDQALKMLLTL